MVGRRTTHRPNRRRRLRRPRRDLARWRDRERIPDHVAGYGPPPDEPSRLDEWRTLTDRSLAIRHYLRNHAPPSRPSSRSTLPTPAPDSTNSTRSSARPRPINDSSSTNCSPPQATTSPTSSNHCGPRRIDSRPDATGSSNTGLTSSNTTNSGPPRLARPARPLAHRTVPRGRRPAGRDRRRTATDEPELTPLPELDRLARPTGRKPNSTASTTSEPRCSTSCKPRATKSRPTLSPLNWSPNIDVDSQNERETSTPNVADCKPD